MIGNGSSDMGSPSAPDRMNKSIAGQAGATGAPSSSSPPTVYK
jgi:hypothetical protein